MSILGSFRIARAIDILLTLPAGEGGAPLAYPREIPVRHFHDELVGVRHLRRALDLLVRRARPAETDVLPHGVGEEKRILRHEPHLASQRLERHLADVPAVYENAARRRPVEIEEQGRERGLARAGAADEGGGASRRNLEGNVIQHRLVFAVRERHSFVRHGFPAGFRSRSRRPSPARRPEFRKPVSTAASERCTCTFRL